MILFLCLSAGTFAACKEKKPDRPPNESETPVQTNETNETNETDESVATDLANPNDVVIADDISDTQSDPAPELPALVPPTLHLVFVQGLVPERRNLIHARRVPGQKWKQILLTRSNETEQLVGRATVQLEDVIRPMVSFSQHTTENLRRPNLDFIIATTKSDSSGFESMKVNSSPRPNVISLSGTIASGSGKKIAMTHQVQIDGWSKLSLLDYSSNEVASTQEIKNVQLPITDFDITIDTSGTPQFAYLKNHELFVGSRDENNIVQIKKVDIPGCLDPVSISIKAAADGRISVLHTCSFSADTGTECRLGISSGTSQTKFEHIDLALIGLGRPCAPFTADRPSFSIDKSEKTHIGYRFREESTELWQIGYLSGNLSGFDPIENIGEPGSNVGHIHVSLDSKEKPYFVWLHDDVMHLAEGESPWVIEPIVFDELVSHGLPVALTSFVIAGGR